MRLRTVIRKTAKWGGLGLSALFISAIITSRYTGVGWFDPALIVGISSGRVFFTTNPMWFAPRSEWRWFPSARWNLGAFELWLDVTPGGGPGPFWTIPIWMLLVPSIAVALAASRADVVARRREREGHCPSCGYNRAGLAAAAVCPECGVGPEGQPIRAERVKRR